jgi:quaternary ammonium compound-resistance protein SugE
LRGRTQGRQLKAWAVLFVSSVLEAVWASALAASDGLQEPVATVIFVVAMTLSMFGLGFAMREIPVGTAYAVWTGVGAALTGAYARGGGSAGASVPKVLLLAGIISCVVGLKLLKPAPRADVPRPAPGETEGRID